MSAVLTKDRKDELKLGSLQLLKKEQVSIRKVAKVVRMLVASFTAVRYGSLYYHHLENDKKLALKYNRGNFDSLMSLSFPGRKELFV